MTSTPKSRKASRKTVKTARAVLAEVEQKHRDLKNKIDGFLTLFRDDADADADGEG